MSVTFFVEALDLGTFTVECWATGQPVPVTTEAPSYDAARTVATDHQATCEACAYDRAMVSGNMDVDVSANMSNANAAVVMLALDLPFEDGDMYGHEDGAAFLARVLVAMGTERLDEGAPVAETRTASGALWIDCGRAPGYVAGRLADLHAVATVAVSLGRSIHWG